MVEPSFHGQRILVTGAAGQLGGSVVPALSRAGALPIGLGSRPAPRVDVVVDITDAKAVAATIGAVRPDAVVHAAAWTDVDGCERDPARAEAVNAAGSCYVANAARAAGTHLVMVSTDFAFPGDGDAPYYEDAPTRPLSVYGWSKLADEEGVRSADPGFAVARTAWLYGGPGKHFPRTVVTVLRDRGTIEVVDNEAGNPTFAGDLAAALISLLAMRGAGIFHLTNAGRAIRFELARVVAEAAGFDPTTVAPTTTAAFLAKYPLPARRPMDSTLANVRASDLGIVLHCAATVEVGRRSVRASLGRRARRCAERRDALRRRHHRRRSKGVNILVTGGAGFIGSAYVRYILATHPSDEVITLDLLTYAGCQTNLDGVLDDPRHRFVRGDIADATVVEPLVAASDAVVNFAAETHVDRSLLDASSFARSNVTGVLTLLEAARQHGVRLVHVSTDEVYGDVEPGRFSSETDPLLPRSPYAAAKAGGELMCRAYHVSYGTEVLVTRGCNTIGPRQYPEKLVPLFVTNALRDQPLPVYGDGLQVRDWLHAEDHARAIDLVLRRGRPGEVYNVGAGHERPNMEVVRAILARLGKPESLIRHVPDRPGHDRRYALDGDKIRGELGWLPARTFEQTLHDTVDWYLANPAWWAAIRGNNEFASYYERQYGWRLVAAEGGDR